MKQAKANPNPANPKVLNSSQGEGLTLARGPPGGLRGVRELGREEKREKSNFQSKLHN
jgi:hypothetical protein